MADNMERSPSARDLEKENRVLRAENDHLRRILAAHGLSSACTLISKPIAVPTTNSQPAETM
jgi:regulator of replication initiation timing